MSRPFHTNLPRTFGGLARTPLYTDFLYDKSKPRLCKQRSTVGLSQWKNNMKQDPPRSFSSPSGTYTQELAIIKRAIRQASDRIRQICYEGLNIQIKPDGSPVTNADLEVDRILGDTLLEAFPDDGWLSEERPDHPSRLQQSRVWILDPIDGTRPFTQSLPQYSISLALIEQGQPVLGVIMNPATQEYYSAVRGAGAYLNGKPLNLANLAPLSSLNGITRPTILVSPTSLPPHILEEWQPLAHCPLILGSIAYSLAMVASGQAHGVINLGRQYEWDVAAGTLIIQEAGGIILDKNQQPISLNQPHPIVNGIMTAHPPVFPILQTLLQSLP